MKTKDMWEVAEQVDDAIGRDILAEVRNETPGPGALRCSLCGVLDMSYYDGRLDDSGFDIIGTYDGVKKCRQCAEDDIKSAWEKMEAEDGMRRTAEIKEIERLLRSGSNEAELRRMNCWRFPELIGELKWTRRFYGEE